MDNKERKDRKIILQCLHALEKEFAIVVEKDNKIS